MIRRLMPATSIEVRAFSDTVRDPLLFLGGARFQAHAKRPGGSGETMTLDLLLLYHRQIDMEIQRSVFWTSALQLHGSALSTFWVRTKPDDLVGHLVKDGAP